MQMTNKHVKRMILCEICQARYDRWVEARSRLAKNEPGNDGKLFTIKQVNDLLDTFMRHYKQCKECQNHASVS
jgi:hypothetical protein